MSKSILQVTLLFRCNFYCLCQEYVHMFLICFPLSPGINYYLPIGSFDHFLSDLYTLYYLPILSFFISSIYSADFPPKYNIISEQICTLQTIIGNLFLWSFMLSIFICILCKFLLDTDACKIIWHLVGKFYYYYVVHYIWSYEPILQVIPTSIFYLCAHSFSIFVFVCLNVLWLTHGHYWSAGGSQYFPSMISVLLKNSSHQTW